MARKPDPNPQTREALEVLAEYERRLAARGRTAPSNAATGPGDEIDDYVRIHQRVAALDLPEVAPSVRSVILGAAFEAAEKHSQESTFVRWLKALLRPGPMMVLVAGAAVVLAVVVRPDRQADTSDQAGAEAVALNEVPAPEAAPQAEVAPPLPVENAAAAPPAPAASPAPTVAPAQPMRTIEAEPASLGPVPNGEEKAKASAANLDKPARKQEILAELKDFDAQGPAGNPAQGNTTQDKLAKNKKALNVEDYPQQAAAAADEGFAAAPPPRSSAPAAEPVLAAKEAPPRDDAELQASEREVYGQAARAENTRQMAERRQAASPMADTSASSDKADDGNPAAIAKLRAQYEKTSDPDVRAALLGKILVLARKSDDRKTETWALAQLESARSRARVSAPKTSVPAQEQAPTAPNSK